jgi:hypothetical protein
MSHCFRNFPIFRAFPSLFLDFFDLERVRVMMTILLMYFLLSLNIALFPIVTIQIIEPSSLLKICVVQ